ncbi:structural maintenance of chromosomes protein 5-like [Engraulis encrasicolus]|uniref:structural maintenance of chromosomes protein 5-like n=1 Tax=Engraulis encrasicolus TaxID=184585 RepID=UPI002FD00EC5
MLDATHDSCVEAVVGSYKLTTKSFRALQNPGGWLTDEDGPMVLRDLPRAMQWLQGSCHQLRGRVHEPPFLKLDEEDKEEAIKNLYENEFSGGVYMEPFSFHFEHPEDMEGFLRECRDNQKMVVYVQS